MNAIVIFSLIGAAVATTLEPFHGDLPLNIGETFVGREGKQFPNEYFIGREGKEYHYGQYPIGDLPLNVGEPLVDREGKQYPYWSTIGRKDRKAFEFLPETRSEFEYPVYQYGRHSIPQMYKYQHYNKMGYEYPMYGKQYYPEAYSAFPYLYSKYYNEERPVYDKSYYPEMYKESTYMRHYPYYKNYEYPVYKYQKYDYPLYKHEEYETPVYGKGYPWVHSQYHREQPIYKNYPVDYLNEYVH